MIMLDTHAWIWWTNESANLSTTAMDAINESNVIGIAAISPSSTIDIVQFYPGLSCDSATVLLN